MIDKEYKDCTSLLEKALNIAVDSHRGQVDKGGRSYIFHPLRVASRCATDDEKIVALLHDTVEDTYVTPGMLKDEGFPDRIIEAVASVTKREGECYLDFVRRAALNPIGREVKKHDLEDNMNLCRLKSVKPEDSERFQKYVDAYNYLTKIGCAENL